MSDDVQHIRSFRVVFDLERRIHRIDRFRVPLPYGLPVRSVGYAAVALVAVLMLARVPIVGDLLSGLPAPARYVLVPAGVSYALTQLRLDGRSAHRAVAAWLRYAVAPRNLAAFRPLPAQRQAHLDPLTCVVGDARRRVSVPASREGDDGTRPQLELVGRDQLELV